VTSQIKTTASSTYRVWPNSGSLEAGETARVQVLLLGTKVDLSDPRRVEECRRDRFQVRVCEPNV
jgi:MSP (Major sperm protein) domain